MDNVYKLLTKLIRKCLKKTGGSPGRGPRAAVTHPDPQIWEVFPESETFGARIRGKLSSRGNYENSFTHS
jgi:hypothetical protein